MSESWIRDPVIHSGVLVFLLKDLGGANFLIEKYVPLLMCLVVFYFGLLHFAYCRMDPCLQETFFSGTDQNASNTKVGHFLLSFLLRCWLD